MLGIVHAREKWNSVGPPFFGQCDFETYGPESVELADAFENGFLGHLLGCQRLVATVIAASYNFNGCSNVQDAHPTRRVLVNGRRVVAELFQVAYRLGSARGNVQPCGIRGTVTGLN